MRTPSGGGKPSNLRLNENQTAKCINESGYVAQWASPAIATLMSPITTTKRQGYVKLFLDMSLPLGVEAQNEKEYLAFFIAIFLMS